MERNPIEIRAASKYTSYVLAAIALRQCPGISGIRYTAEMPSRIATVSSAWPPGGKKGGTIVTQGALEHSGPASPTGHIF